MIKKSKSHKTPSDQDRIEKANWTLLGFFMLVFVFNVAYVFLRKYPAVQRLDNYTGNIANAMNAALMAIKNPIGLGIYIAIMAIFSGLSIGLKYGYDKLGKTSFKGAFLFFNGLLITILFFAMCILLIFSGVNVVSTLFVSLLFTLLNAMVLNILGKRMKTTKANIGSYGLFVLSLFFIGCSFLFVPSGQSGGAIVTKILFIIAYIFIMLSIMFYGKDNTLDLWFLIPYMFLTTFYNILIMPGFISTITNNLAPNGIIPTKFSPPSMKSSFSSTAMSSVKPNVSSSLPSTRELLQDPSVKSVLEHPAAQSMISEVSKHVDLATPENVKAVLQATSIEEAAATIDKVIAPTAPVTPTVEVAAPTVPVPTPTEVAAPTAPVTPPVGEPVPEAKVGGGQRGLPLWNYQLTNW